MRDLGPKRLVPLCPGGTMRNHLTTFCVIATTLALGACTEGAGSRGIAPVSLALSSAVSAAAQAGGAETFTPRTNTLVISSVEVVLRKVELKRADARKPRRARGPDSQTAHGRGWRRPGLPPRATPF